MQTFQIKEKSRGATEKMVKTEGGKGKFEGKQEIEPRKKEAKEPLRDRREKAAFEGIGKSREKIIRRSADKAEQRAEQKGVQMAHLKSPASFPFPLP